MTALRLPDKNGRTLPALKPVERNSVLNGIADLRSAIQRATIARLEFRNVARCALRECSVCDVRFGAKEAAYLDGVNSVRDALGALGLGPSEINQLGEVLI